MSHGRLGGNAAGRGNYRHSLLQVLSSFTPAAWSPTTGMRGHWCEWALALVAVLMNLSPLPSAHTRFAQARQLLVAAGPRLALCGKTYQGFIKALVLHGRQFVRVFAAHLQGRLLQLPPEQLLINGWNAFAVDGSFFDAPRTKSNRKRLRFRGTGGSNHTHPQMMLSAIYHMSTGVLFNWRVGPSRASERTLLRKQIKDLPPGCIIVGDAGFFGFDLLSKIVESGRSFLIRGGGGVHLIRPHQRKSKYMYWPLSFQDSPPLPVRLIRVNGIELFTNVLDDRKLTKRTARKLYEYRWGIEVMFRSIKQTMERRKVRSKSGSKALLELEWIAATFQLLSLWMAELSTRCRRGELSVAGVLTQVRVHIHPAERRSAAGLLHRLRRCTMDEYERTASKKSKRWPRKKVCKPPKRIRIRAATAKELSRLQQLASESVE